MERETRMDQSTRYAQHGTAFCLESAGATVAEHADHLAILADALLTSGTRSDVKTAGEIAAWIDAARSGQWWNWRTPLSLVRAFTIEDFRRVKEVTNGRIVGGEAR